MAAIACWKAFAPSSASTPHTSAETPAGNGVELPPLPSEAKDLCLPWGTIPDSHRDPSVRPFLSVTATFAGQGSAWTPLGQPNRPRR